MASNAEKCRAYRARQKERQQSLGEAILHLPMLAGTKAALADLMAWHGFEDEREAVTTMIHRMHNVGPAASGPFFVVSRHEYIPSEDVLRHLEREGRIATCGGEE